MERHGVDQPASGRLEQYKFDVFISYSRRDAAFARRLQRALGSYAPPADLPVPQRRLRVFRDESDFQGTEYGAALGGLLQSAAKLLVICSPSSRSSPYVGDEIAKFAAMRGNAHIVTVLLAGVPNNEGPGTDAQKAFHDELVARLPVPLAADYRGWREKRDRVDGDRFESAWHKLLADIYAEYGVDRSGIEQREKLRQRRIRRIRSAVVGALTLVLASLTVWALISRQEAIRQRNTAQSRLLAAQSMSGAHPYDLALLLAVAAQRTAPSFEAWEALFVGLQRQPALQRFLHGVDAPVQRISVDRAGTCAAAWTESNRTFVWELATGVLRAEIAGNALPGNSCGSVVVAPGDGAMEARALGPGQERRWSVTDLPGSLTAWAIAPTDTTLAAAHAGGQLVLRGMEDGRIRTARVDPGSTFRYLRFSADGQSIAGIDQQQMVHRWSAGTLAASSPAVRCGKDAADVFAISSDLRWCAAGGPGRLTVTALHGTPAKELDLGTPWILALDFSYDNRALMAGVQGGDLQFWNMEAVVRDAARAGPATWSEHRSDVVAAAYAPDGESIVSAARDRSMIVWRSEPSNRLVSEIARVAGATAVAVDDHAGRVVTGAGTGDLVAWPAGRGHTGGAVPLTNLGKAITAVAVRTTGEIVASTEDGEIVAVSSQSRRRAFAPGHGEPIVRIRFNHDESRAAAAARNGTVTVWTTATGTLLATFAGERRQDGQAGGLTPGVDAAFDPRGDRLASIHGHQQAFLWDWTGTTARFSPLPFRPTSYFTSVAFGPDGRTIALGTGIYGGEVVLIDLAAAGAPAARLPAHDLQDVTALAFSPDGRLLFSGGFDARVAAWEVAGRRRIGEVHRAPGSITSLSYATDGTGVTAVTEGGVVLRWNLDVRNWLEEACRVANRQLSAEERARFAGGIGDEIDCPER